MFGIQAGRPGVAHAALGGPVIIGGDDLTDHGDVDIDGTTPLDGWLYIERALENIDPNVHRAGNDGTVAALGATDSSDSCHAGKAIFIGAQAAGLSVTYHEGGPAIDQFFADLASGAENPAIIWIAGTGDSCDLDSVEADSLTAHAIAIADFVNSGGGLLSHGVEYGWLFALLPDATTVNSGGSDDLYFTADGLAALPSLTESDINAGPWHNHFEGDFGGLKVLVRSNIVLDSSDNDAAVIIGGASVVLPGSTPSPAHTAAATPCIGGIVGSRCPGNPPDVQVTVTPEATATSAPPPPPPTAAPPQPAATQPGGGAAGVIIGPNTGSGPGGAGASTGWLIASAVLLATGAISSSAAMKMRRR
ncbi:MAG: hypothetical protein EPO22_03265 [Dehalococcoidia bacterium]|nr:MAG: hypothetical protein EPO22_03265 [Dehalococcoidia bacterium]